MSPVIPLDYTGDREAAKEQIEEAGRTVTFYKTSERPKDSAKPWLGPVLEEQPGVGQLRAVCKAVFVPAAGSGLGHRKVRVGNVVKVAEKIALVAAASLADGTNLEEFDGVRDGDRVWALLFADEFAPGDVPILYQVGLAR